MQRLIRAGVLLAVIAGALAGVGRSAPGAEAAGPGTWTLASNVPDNHATTTSVLLRNGSVLLVGGWVQSFDPQNAFGGHRYNPTTNTWTQTGLQITPRRDATVTQLPIGNVLMAGGTTGGADGLASTEFYRPFSNDWIAGPPLTDARRGHVAVALLDDRVLHIGGSDEGTCLSSVESYDPVGNSFSAADSLAAARDDFDGVLLQDGRVLVAGGGTCGGAVTATAEIFDPGTGDWAPAADMLSARRHHKMTLLPDGRVLAVGGTVDPVVYPISADAVGAEVYDPASDTWTATGAMVHERAYHDIVLLGNGTVLAAGGWSDGAGIAETQLTSAETYDPDTNTWTATGDLQHGRADQMNLAMLYDGRVLATGGEASLLYLNPTAELYDPTSWRAVASPAVPRARHTATLLTNGKVLVAGGGTADAELYDEATDTWSPAGTMSAPRESHVAVRLNDGRVLVVGGTNGPATGPPPNSLLTAEIYNPATNSWTPATSPSLEHLQFGSGAVLLTDGRVFVLTSNSYTIPAEIYNPTANSWTFASENPEPQSTVHVVRTSLGRVLALAAYDQSAIYDPATDSWSSAGSSGAFFPGVPATADNSSLVVVSGGHIPCQFGQVRTSAEVWRFDGMTQTWAFAAGMATSRSFHGGTALYDGRLLVTGGEHLPMCPGFDPNPPIVTLASAEAYSSSLNTWSAAGSLVSARARHTATRLASGRVLLVGGKVGAAVVTGTEVYDLGVHTDTDGDGYHDGVELALGQHPWSYCGTMRADVNMDGNINSIDQLKLAQNYFSKPPQERVDQDGNLRINSIDQLKLGQQIAKSVLMCP